MALVVTGDQHDLQRKKRGCGRYRGLGGGSGLSDRVIEIQGSGTRCMLSTGSKHGQRRCLVADITLVLRVKC